MEILGNKPYKDEFEELCLRLYECENESDNESSCDHDCSSNNLYGFHNHKIVKTRDMKWDVKLRDAIQSGGVNALEDIEEALENRADINSLSEEETSNLSLAFNTNTLEPMRGEVIRSLVQSGAKFADEEEENDNYRGNASQLSPCVLEDLVYYDCFKSIHSGTVLSEMRWLIMTRKPNAVATMRGLIQQAKIIFYYLKEKQKTDDDGDDIGDEDDKYMDLDDFLSNIIDGETLLHLVIERRLFDTECLPLLYLLIDEGARVCTKDKHGRTPRELASILIGSSLKRPDMNVIAVLEREEAREQSRKRKVDLEKIKAIGMTLNERVAKGSMFERFDPCIISTIIEDVRRR